jgi:hypothetical protein
MIPDLTPLALRIETFIENASNPSAAPGDFDSLAADVLAAQAHTNPAYAAWCRIRRFQPGPGVPWQDYPAVPTEAFKGIEFSSIPAADRTTEFRSSGTTAQIPSRHFHHERSLQLYRASALPWFQRHLLPGSPPHPRFVSLTPPAVSAPNSSLVHMLDAAFAAFAPSDSLFVGRIGPDRAWEVDINRLLDATTETAREQRPVLLLGTAFNVVHLLDALLARSHSLQLPPGSRLMETGGYKGRSRELPRAELHAEAARLLGLRPAAIVTEYGMSELGSQGYDRIVSPASAAPAVAPIFQFPPWARARVVSPESGQEVADGEAGIVQVLDLANLWSVSAVRTSDEAIRRGNTFELRGRLAQAEPRGCSRMTA